MTAEPMPRDVSRARAALGAGAEFICGDMRNSPFPEADAVVILDGPHCIAIPGQHHGPARVKDGA